VTEEIREEQIPEESTAQPDPAEPAGDQDPATEQEYDEARDEAVEEVASSEPEPDPAAEAAKYLDLAQRTQAELENLRKRAARDVLQAGARAKANLVRELLPVVDNLERALATANPEEDHLADGVRLVHAELVGTLERNGIKAFDPAGEPFDPTVHEAISMREGENGSGIVLDVVEKGYRLGDNVIRPARVVVSS
jgi:molecular chaperone GrpE